MHHSEICMERLRETTKQNISTNFSSRLLPDASVEIYYNILHCYWGPR